MTYEAPELVLVDEPRNIVLGLPNGIGDNDGTFPNQLVEEGLAVGLDD